MHYNSDSQVYSKNSGWPMCTPVFVLCDMDKIQARVTMGPCLVQSLLVWEGSRPQMRWKQHPLQQMAVCNQWHVKDATCQHNFPVHALQLTYVAMQMVLNGSQLKAGWEILELFTGSGILHLWTRYGLEIHHLLDLYMNYSIAH